MSAFLPMLDLELFETKGNDFAQTVRVIRKAGEPWLILPESSGAAAEALALYPAQTKKARMARWALGVALKLKMPLGARRATVRLSREDAFVRFLSGLTGGKGEAPFTWAMLAGNARAAGRRFIVLLFDEQGQPVFVVKAGVGEAARRLIQKENLFLRLAPKDVAGLPTVRSTFASGRVEALALAYAAGDSPRAGDWEGLGKLLSGWVDRDRKVRVEDLAAWQILEREQGGDEFFRKLAEKLKGAEFKATLFHGDFAPWNIKVKDGVWTALDWERGELRGFPGWDWFHYVVQAGILVEKLSAQDLAGKLERLFADAGFREYAEKSGMAGRERVLAAAYLFYCGKILRPTEGRETGEALLDLAGRWVG